MSSIAAVLGGSHDRAVAALERVIEAQRPPGARAVHCGECGIAHLARSSNLNLPEDHFDRQPLMLRNGRWIAVAEGRLDNREEIAARTNLANTRHFSDAMLILAEWERIGPRAGECLVGDYALIRWDEDRQRLSLFRSPLGTRALFVAHHAGMLLVATLPQALVAAGYPAIFDHDHAAAAMSGADFGTDRTVFTGISKVRPGELREYDATGGLIVKRAMWKPKAEVQPSTPDLADRFRGMMERCVADRLRRSRGSIATHLSAGRDSGVVTAISARLAPGQVDAFTAAPRAGFVDSGFPDKLLDESGPAAGLARYNNVRHHIIRSGDAEPDLIGRVRQLHRFSDGPLLNLGNMLWWNSVGTAARSVDAHVLLTGQNGNYTVSNGGVSVLGDLRLEQGWRHWWPVARALGLDPLIGWETVAHQSFRGLLPSAMLDRLRQWRRPAISASSAYVTLSPAFRSLVEGRASASRSRTPTSQRAALAEWLPKMEFADRTMVGLHGVELRDPTADQRLAEFCLSLPAEGLVDGRNGRPLFEQSFGDLFPPAYKEERRRGLQSADWMEQFSGDRVRGAFEEAFASSIVRDLVDRREIERLIASWPVPPTTPALRGAYRDGLLRTLGLALFVADHFP